MSQSRVKERMEQYAKKILEQPLADVNMVFDSHILRNRIPAKLTFVYDGS